MSAPALGRLEKVDLRKVWTSEAGQFTPWLAQPENVKLLGETIGIELEVEAQEKGVGPFRADIVCRDLADPEALVLIENQLERTDHTHLGQLMTYAAGLHAVTIVWIAERFTDEHRAALDWLNESTNQNINFFGLEVELWRIGQSPMAPKFNVVCQPNNWSKPGGGGTTGGGVLSETKQLQLDFWTQFRTFLLDSGATLRPTKPLPQHWMNFALGRAGFVLEAVCSAWDSDTASYERGELRAQVSIHHERSKALYELVLADKDEIEAEVSEPLQWYNPENARVCRIYLRRSADIQDRSSWPEQHAWLKSKLEALDRTFRPLVRTLEVPAEVSSAR